MAGSTFRWHDLRVIVIGVVVLVAWAAIGYRLFHIQGADAAELAQRGVDQRLRHEPITPKRGTIFDRDGLELALTVYGEALIADPQTITDPERSASVLAPLLGENLVDLTNDLSGDGRYVRLTGALEHREVERLATAIADAGLEGFSFVEEPIRIYPSAELAASVIGLTRLDDGSGLEGIEAIMDDALAGRPGERIVERDAAGRAIPQGEYLIEPATPGSDVFLTIDRQIQYAAEQALGRMIEQSGALSGAAVVLSPSTGRILAMVSLPTFDPNKRSDLDPDLLRNRTVVDVYEPGSTLKVVAVAGALELGIVSPDTEIATPHEVTIGEETYTDADEHPNVMTVADIVTHSSNVGTIEIQRRLGNERHYAFLDAFGLGRPSSIDFGQESAGRLDHYTDWCHSTCGASAAIGYGIGVTPLQLAGLYATIANDGEWVEPHVVAEIVDPDGSAIVTEPRRRQVISAGTAATVRNMLQRVVDSGTGHRAALERFTVGGKTGTADKFDVEAGVYSDDETIAWFAGIAPITDPQIVTVVVLDAPSGVADDGGDLKFGGGSAAPVFAEIAEASLNQLGVAPDKG
jgi:cell division protein FtsI (penicillin-binding protein 3)